MQIKNSSVGGYGIQPIQLNDINKNIHFGHKLPTIKETKQSITLGKRTIDLVRKLFFKKKSEMPLVSDIFVVKNNQTKEHAKEVVSKLNNKSLDYQASLIRDKKPDSFTLTEKSTLQKNITHLYEKGQINERDFRNQTRNLGNDPDKIKNQYHIKKYKPSEEDLKYNPNFRGNEHIENDAGVNNNIDIANFDDIKDVATITKESTISDLDVKTVTFDDLPAVDMTNNLPEVHPTSSDSLMEHSTNFLESSLDNISDSAEHIKNVIKKLIDIISGNMDS